MASSNIIIDDRPKRIRRCVLCPELDNFGASLRGALPSLD